MLTLLSFKCKSFPLLSEIISILIKSISNRVTNNRYYTGIKHVFFFI